jgi:hypothetical protein
MFNPEGFRYFQETRQPIYSAALVLPFFLIYQVGLLLLDSRVINGGDAIVLNLGAPLFRFLSVPGCYASALVLVVGFIVWQLWHKLSWHLEFGAVCVTFLESLVYAVLLFVVLTYFLDCFPTGHAKPGREKAAQTASAKSAPAVHAPPTPDRPVVRASPAPYRPGIQDFVLFCGAGVYEELVFRLLLLGLLILVLTKLFHLEHAYAAAWAVILGALIFSGFHHLGGEAFSLGPFLQRVFAGVFFAAIYVNRSFGIAAASHALYDILVGVNQLASA